MMIHNGHAEFLISNHEFPKTSWNSYMMIQNGHETGVPKLSSNLQSSSCYGVCGFLIFFLFLFFISNFIVDITFLSQILSWAWLAKAACHNIWLRIKYETSSNSHCSRNIHIRTYFWCILSPSPSWALYVVMAKASSSIWLSH